MKKQFPLLELLEDLLVIGLGGAFVALFILQTIYGEVTLIEPNPVIRFVEMGLFVLIVLFGISRLVKTIREKL